MKRKEYFDHVCIIGCGGHARSAADILVENNPLIDITFYDVMARENEMLMNKYSVFAKSKLQYGSDNLYFVAIGDNKRREKEYNKLVRDNVISVVSKNSCISSMARIGGGCFVGNYSSIGPESKIGENCIINTGAIVEHECLVGNHSHISVGAKVCGRTNIGERVFVGAGAVVIDKLSICNDVVVAAGAIVVNDIVEPGVYIGTPAKRKGK